MRRAVTAALLTLTIVLQSPVGYCSDRVPTKPADITKNVRWAYDRFKDRSGVALKYQTVEDDSPGSIDFTASFTCRGDTLTKPAHVLLTLIYHGKEWRYLRENQRSLMFLVGSDRIPVEFDTHNGEVERSAWVTETMAALVAPAVALRILEAAPDGQLGFDEFRFTEESAAAMKELAGILRSTGVVASTATSKDR